jgi:lysine 2,3-aminomutase
MTSWHRLLTESIEHPEALPARFRADVATLNRVATVYPMRVNPYFLSLIREKDDPLWRQAIPDERELGDTVCQEDPLNEENLSPVPNLVHKYPDRALFLVHAQCAVYCRFCTRKRKVGTPKMRITRETIRAGLDYLARTPEIRDVLLSGGDPLLLFDESLDQLLASIRRIPSIEIIRIGSRTPCTLPMRITARLVRILKKYHPLYINTHFNHPMEITSAAARACERLVNGGIPLGCQTVLLRGVNDSPAIMKDLMHGLLRIRVRPYYLFQADMTRGTDHFRTSIEHGQRIMRSLIGHTSGLAVPTYAVDAPGGGGKIPLTPNYIRQMGEEIIFDNYCGIPCSYGNVQDEKPDAREDAE